MSPIRRLLCKLGRHVPGEWLWLNPTSGDDPRYGRRCILLRQEDHMSDLRKGELRNGTRLEEEHGPAVCPNGHAMDEGYFNCPCCGAYRPSANAPQPKLREKCCGIIWEHGALTSARPCHDCPERTSP